ncbi:Hypothetical predicted protein [Mytilus galloprovincialis]|uniref:G-protein coupled receptors family 2 profile 2 domain-containing protein n=1 Tax=Mytilus galloprovincialis TaxID=29158 RepID=A0A8B6EXZ2_MYTGA|nr:Hypothetical predicted protein [Mytilus galloprovincialis]
MIEFVKVTRTAVRLPQGDTSNVAEVRLDVTITKPSFIHEIKSMEQNLSNLMWNMFLTYDNNTIEIIKEQNLPLTMQNESFGRIFRGLEIKNIVKDLSRNSVNLSKSEHIGCKRISVLAGQIELFKIQVMDIVCHEYFGQQDSNKSGDFTSSIKAILTYFCFSVSVVALVFSLILSRQFNISSSIAGSNMENISISLICANILFMIGSFITKPTILCYTVGIFLHYLWLSVFSFMWISVLYIAKNLTSMKSGNKTIKQTGTFTRRVLMVSALLIPVVFVVPAVILDQFDVENLSAGYGNPGCFPNRYPANIIFFSGPVVFCAVISYAILMRVIVKICLRHIKTKHIIQSSNFQHAKLFMRLVLLSGIFWVTGFLSGILKSEWLEYIFILLCGLQGLFFSIANLTTRYMYGNLKSTFRRTPASSYNLN